VQFSIYPNAWGGWLWAAVSSRGERLMTSPAYASEAECRAALKELEGRLADWLARDQRAAAERRVGILREALASHIALVAGLRREGRDAAEAALRLSHLADELDAARAHLERLQDASNDNE
jgi:hypothetical protein